MLFVRFEEVLSRLILVHRVHWEVEDSSGDYVSSDNRYKLYCCLQLSFVDLQGFREPYKHTFELLIVKDCEQHAVDHCECNV